MENTDSARAIGADAFAAYAYPAILDAAPRILSISSDFGPYKSENQLITETELVQLHLRFLLDSLRELVIIKSAGNDFFSGEYAAFPWQKRVALLNALLALRADSLPYASRIVIVGATDNNHGRARFSNSFRGGVDLYAPGVGVSLLQSDGSIKSVDGTSFSTPLVAGVAAQLLAMDPSLSAADVKALLLAGAIDSVENSNGVNEFPQKVGNTSETVYEADAYGSLRALSSRNGTPLCGARLVPLVANDSIIGTRAIRYGGVNSESFSAYTFHSQSLAAGGRLVSLDPAQSQTFAAGAWNTPLHYSDGERRVFGERDTLTFRQFSRFIPGTYEIDLRIRRARSTGSAESWNARSKFGLVQSQGHWFSQPSLSPDGNRVLFPYGTWHAPAQRARLGIIDSAGVAQNIPLWPDGSASYGALTAWKPDGTAALIYTATNNTVLFAGTGNPDYESRLVLVTFSGNSATTQTLQTEPNRVPFRIRWSDEGRRVTLVDEIIGAPSDCRVREYSFTGTLTLRTTQNVAKNPDCANEISDRLAVDGYVGLFLGDPGAYVDESGGGGGGGGMASSVVRQPDTTISPKFWMRNPRRVGARARQSSVIPHLDF